MEDKDFIDNEIWVENRIEEVRQELEEILQEEFKNLNYKKTIENINIELKNLDKQSKQFDYNKDRALESLEEDFSLKLNDLKILEENLLADKIKNLEQQSTDYINYKIENLDKKIKDEIKGNLEDFKNKQKENIKKFEEEDAQKLNKIKENITEKIEKAKNISIDSANDKFNKCKEIIEEHKGNVDEIIKNLEKTFKDLIEVNENEIKSIEEGFNLKIKELKEENHAQLEKIDLKTAMRIKNLQTDIYKKIEERQQEIIGRISILESNDNEKVDKNEINELKQDYIKYKNKMKNMEKVVENAANLDVVLKNLEKEKEKLEKERIENLKEMKMYVESRILRMKYVSNIQAIKEEFSKLRKRIHDLEEENVKSKENIDIEAIVNQKVEEALKNMQLDNNEKIKKAKKVETIDDILYDRKINVNTENKAVAVAKQIANVTKKRSQILNMNDN